MGEDGTSITVSEPVRDELRRYKAQDGLTFNQAVARLLAKAGWIDAQYELVEESNDD
jgi:hypothetical protein